MVMKKFDRLRMKLYMYQYKTAIEAIARSVNIIENVKMKLVDLKTKYGLLPELNCKRCGTISFVEQVECGTTKKGHYFICNSCKKKNYFKVFVKE